MQLKPTSSAVVLLLMLALGACGTGPSGDQAGATDDTLELNDDEAAVVKVDNKLFSIPSPVQTVLLIRDLKAPYQADLLLPTDRSTNFASRSQQALALGVYGADMAYAAVHEDGQQSLKLLKAIEGLSDKLGVSNALDSDLVGAFRDNIDDQDGLLRLTGQAFRAVDRYLKNEERHDVSTNVLAGGWIEGLYLTLGANGENLDPRVVDRLAEQGHTLDNLIQLLERNDSDSGLLVELKGLAVLFRDVTIHYEYVEPTLDPEHKTTYINSVTHASVSAETLAGIVSKVRAIRATIIA